MQDILYAQVRRTMAEREVTGSAARVSDMETVEIRAVIKYLFIKGLSGKEAYEDLASTLGENAPSFTMVKKAIEAVESFLCEKDPDFFKQGFLKLQQRWMKCIQKKGDYVEK